MLHLHERFSLVSIPFVRLQFSVRMFSIKRTSRISYSNIGAFLTLAVAKDAILDIPK